MTARIPRHDLAAERAVLGATLLEPDAAHRVLGSLSASDFFDRRHAITWAAIERIAQRGGNVDHVALRGELDAHGELAQAGGDEALLGLVAEIPTAAMLETHARTVRDAALVRRMTEACGRVFALGYDASLDPADFVERAEAAVLGVRSSSLARRPDLEHASVHAAKLRARIEAARQSGGTGGLPTGIRALDRAITGLHPGDLVVIGARPGVGKSALATGIALEAARQGDGVAFFSLEMGGDQVLLRMAAASARVDIQAARNGRLRGDEAARFDRKLAQLEELPIFVCDDRSVTIAGIRSACRRLLATTGRIGLVAVDYLQLTSGQGRYDARHLVVGEISRGLKALAGELDTPVVALSQLNRAVEDRKEAEPRLSDLRESGAIEQDADAVLLIHRRVEEETGAIIVAKQRNGPCGRVDVRWLGHCALYVDAALWDAPTGRPTRARGEFDDEESF